LTISFAIFLQNPEGIVVHPDDHRIDPDSFTQIESFQYLFITEITLDQVGNVDQIPGMGISADEIPTTDQAADLIVFNFTSGYLSLQLVK
jgi:hypothetical protein